MRKKPILFGLLVFSLILMSPLTLAQDTEYSCAASEGGTKYLKVDTVDETGLEEMFGSNWATVLENSFGSGADEVGARQKSTVTDVKSDIEVDLGLGLGKFPACNITTDAWNWETGEFSEEPDLKDFVVTVLLDPDDLTEYTQTLTAILALGIPGYSAQNVSMHNPAVQFLGQLPVPADEYLAALVWEEGWNVDGLKVSHEHEAGYTSLFGTTYQADGKETWEFDGQFGAFIGYTLEDADGNVIYAYSLDVSALIPGYELTFVMGSMMAGILGVIYVFKRRH
ncbi:MAG: conserved exported protein of unknown function [Promethearchaeota archaeon]|nr:MAG: conserved exported protein of unknown function [Candidatus Lokiarchaeota archaeon]